MENIGIQWKPMNWLDLLGVTLSFGAHTGEIFCNAQHFVKGNLQDQFILGNTKRYLFICGNEFPYGLAGLTQLTPKHRYL